MKKNGGVKKRPGLKKGLRKSLAPRFGKLKDKKIKDKCTACGFEHYVAFLFCPHCSAVNRKRVPLPVERCPKCGSTNIEHVQPFDHIRQCNNPKCPYRIGGDKGWKYQWSGRL
jgi:hypothetical protein